MRGIITRVQVLAHPLVVVECFGVKVLVRALFSGARQTFLEIVSQCAEEDAHQGMADLDLARIVERFVGFECRVRDLYRRLADRFAASPEAARFFTTMSRHEEGHAIVLSRVRREAGRGHLWKESRELLAATVEGFDARLAAFERELRGGVALPRALEIIEAIEGSELNVVFDTLSTGVDLRTRARLERFFVFTQRHLAYCREQLRRLRGAAGVAAG